jgi:hypothetical protein
MHTHTCALLHVHVHEHEEHGVVTSTFLSTASASITSTSTTSTSTSTSPFTSTTTSSTSASASTTSSSLSTSTSTRQHLNRVGRAQRVELQRAALHVSDELLPHVPARVQLVADARLHPRGEALVEPQVVPPVHRHQVTKPLVGELVDDDLGHALTLTRRGVLVDEQVDLAVGHKAPVLHGARGKLRDGHPVQG